MTITLNKTTAVVALTLFALALALAFAAYS